MEYLPSFLWAEIGCRRTDLAAAVRLHLEFCALEGVSPPVLCRMKDE